MEEPPQRWGYRYAIPTELLELKRHDHMSLKYDMEMHSLIFSATRIGSKEDLLRSVDRLIWALEDARKRIVREDSLL